MDEAKTAWEQLTIRRFISLAEPMALRAGEVPQNEGRHASRHR